MVNSWPRPLSTNDIESFLGYTGYYRLFVEVFSSITFPLTALIQNKSKFEWSESYKKSFQLLNDRVNSVTVLTFP